MNNDIYSGIERWTANRRIIFERRIIENGLNLSNSPKLCVSQLRWKREREREQDVLEKEKEDRFVEETLDQKSRGKETLAELASSRDSISTFPLLRGSLSTRNLCPSRSCCEEKKKRRRERKKERGKYSELKKREGEECVFSGGINRGGSDATRTR